MYSKYKEQYPMMGVKWTDEEEKQLLLEISQNMSNQDIADVHKRTIGSITSKIRLIAYKMYKDDVDMSEIITKTKLTEEQVLEIVKLRDLDTNNKKEKMSKTEKDNVIEIKINNSNLENEINKIKEEFNKKSNTDLEVFTEIKDELKSLNKKMKKILKLLKDNNNT